MSTETYIVEFETEFGMMSDVIKAIDAREFHRILKKRHPDDIGADGFYYCLDKDDDYDGEIPINW